MDVNILKYKIIILLILSCVIIYIIYNHNYKKTINITSINSLDKYHNYNDDISLLLKKSNINYNFNVDYSNETYEIENIISKIDNNDNYIQVILHKSNVILLSLGNIDYNNEDLKTIINELSTLFKKIRRINNKTIYYISPYEINNITYIKEICHKYNIIFINGKSFKNKKDLLSKIIFNNIEKIYNS